MCPIMHCESSVQPRLSKEAAGPVQYIAAGRKTPAGKAYMERHNIWYTVQEHLLAYISPMNVLVGIIFTEQKLHRPSFIHNPCGFR